MKKLFILFFFCFFCFFSTGCFLVPFIGTGVSAVVDGVITWLNGEAHKFYNEEPATLHRATKIALDNLKYPILENVVYKDGSYCIIAGDKKDIFRIFIRKVRPHISEVKIRIDFLGNKPFAEMIYHEIDSNTSTVDFDDFGKPTKRRMRQ